MPMYGLPPGLTKPPRPVSEEETVDDLSGRGMLGKAPGTMILVLIFLTAFAVYYFANWKLLSFLWQIG